MWERIKEIVEEFNSQIIIIIIIIIIITECNKYVNKDLNLCLNITI